MTAKQLKNYIPGLGCQCFAHSESECSCNVDWTPKEVYELRAEVRRLRKFEKQSAKANIVVGGKKTKETKP